MERAVVAVDVDHALAELLPAAVAWHNAETGAKVCTALEPCCWNDLVS